MKNFSQLALYGTDLLGNGFGFDDANGSLASRALYQLQFGSGDGDFVDFKIRPIAVWASRHDISPPILGEV